MKVAVIGLGYMGQNHARILTTLKNVELAAVCDIDPKRANDIAGSYGAKRYVNYQELLNAEKLDAVFICLPTSLHYVSAVQALKRKVPVFIEKPICPTIAEAKKLIKLSQKLKTPFMVGHIERFNPVVSEIKNRLKSGELGQVVYIHTQRFSPPPSRIQDVSAIVDLATHDVDIIYYLVNAKPTRIFAETQNKYHKKEDLMSALLRFKNGIIGVVEVSWLHPTKIRNLSVVGEKGMYMANYITQELFFYKQNGKIFKNSIIPSRDQNWADVIKIAFEAREPLQIELEAFVRALQTKSKMPVTPEEGLAALQLTQKFSESGQKHAIIK